MSYFSSVNMSLKEELLSSMAYPSPRSLETDIWALLLVTVKITASAIGLPRFKCPFISSNMMD